MDQSGECRPEQISYSSVKIIWHAALDNLTVDELGIMLERHAQVVFRPDLGPGGHLLEA
jgi:hypothetical protein